MPHNLERILQQIIIKIFIQMQQKMDVHFYHSHHPLHHYLYLLHVAIIVDSLHDHILIVAWHVEVAFGCRFPSLRCNQFLCFIGDVEDERVLSFSLLHNLRKEDWKLTHINRIYDTKRPKVVWLKFIWLSFNSSKHTIQFNHFPKCSRKHITGMAYNCILIRLWFPQWTNTDRYILNVVHCSHSISTLYLRQSTFSVDPKIEETKLYLFFIFTFPPCNFRVVIGFGYALAIKPFFLFAAVFSYLLQLTVTVAIVC